MRTPVLVLALATASLARAETRPRYGGSIEATLLGAPASVDPVAARSHAEITAVGLVFDTLYHHGPDGLVEPHLAAAVPTLDEKRTTVFVPVRKGVRLHDGTELSPTDVAFSLDRARQQAKWLLPALTAVKADGDGVVLTLRAAVADAELMALLALPQLAITKGGRVAGDKPIGTGPFSVDGFDRVRKRLQLRAFDTHFAGRPYVDSLLLTWYDTPDGEARRFETGKSHVSARGATAFASAKPSFRVLDVESPASLLVFLGFGRAHPTITGDVAFRRAIDLAIARGGFTAISRGERVVPTRSPIPLEAGGSTLDAAGRASDTAAATAQLADAQKRVKELAPEKLAALRLEILVEDTRPDDRELAERVVLALDKLGIGAVITAVSAQTLRDRATKGMCDLWIGQLAEPLTMPGVWWAAVFSAGGDDWPLAQLATGRLEPATAAKEFAARLPVVPLMFRSVRMWHPSNLRGLAFDSAARPGYAELHLFGGLAATKAKP